MSLAAAVGVNSGVAVSLRETTYADVLCELDEGDARTEPTDDSDDVGAGAGAG